MKPVRIQLSRKKGFNLQEHSRSINGLDAVNVGRPSMFGNPFRVVNDGDCFAVIDSSGTTLGWSDTKHGANKEAVGLYKEMMARRIAAGKFSPNVLSGSNLACWCTAGMPCHADVLLELANESPTP